MGDYARRKTTQSARLIAPISRSKKSLLRQVRIRRSNFIEE